MMTIGERILQQRKERGLSRKALGDLSGLDLTTLWNIENGYTKRPHHRTLERIAAAMGTDFAEYELENVPYKPPRPREYMPRYRECRERTGRSLAQAAEELGVKETSLDSFECGRRSPSPLVLINMARLYGARLGYLVGYDDTPYTGRRCRMGAPCGAKKRIDYCCADCPERSGCEGQCLNDPARCGLVKGEI